MRAESGGGSEKDLSSFRKERAGWQCKGQTRGRHVVRQPV